MDKMLTEKVRKMAFDMGADLVGFANVERFTGAPVEASPQGLMPSAKTVVVIGIHHPDAVIEQSGYPTARCQKSYYIQMPMCDKLEHIHYHIAKFLETQGFLSLPTNATNSQRYRAVEGSPHTFLAEISHRHAAAAAGLGEFGWSGLLITPEYGPRVRFLSLITEAELEPTPLYDGPRLCDRCGECIRHCPSKALSAEINGLVKMQIEDKVFEYADKNNWRCGWAEHWAFDLNMPLPDAIDENKILEGIVKSGSTGGSLGQCLKYCVPSILRYKQEDYTHGYRRKSHIIANTDIPVHRSILGKMRGILIENSVDNFFVIDEATLANHKICLQDYLPDGKCVLAFFAGFEQCGVYAREEFDTRERLTAANEDVLTAVRECVESGVLDSCRLLEAYGFSGVPLWPEVKDIFVKAAEDEISIEIATGICRIWGMIVTNLPIKQNVNNPVYLPKAKKTVNKSILTLQIIDNIKRMGGDLVGVCSVERADAAAEELEKVYDGEEVVTSLPINGMGKYIPKVGTVKRKILKSCDYLKHARSIITIGFHFPHGIIKCIGKLPANNYMPYSLMLSRTVKEAGRTGYAIIKYLNNLGYKAFMSFDLFNVGSYTATLECEHHDIFANNILAPLSGLGETALNGMAVTPEYGVTQRFLAIITDAELEENGIFDNSHIIDRCKDCSICAQKCPTSAINRSDTAVLKINGKEIRFFKVDRLKCDWAKRYALVHAEGTDSIDMRTDMLPSQNPDIPEFESALRELDPIVRLHPALGQRCVLDCPYIDEYGTQ